MKTVHRASSYEEIIKKSRFVARAARVTSQRESLEFYESVADPQATHNCWAWRIDFQVRSNDDGEPGGTAGRPILNQIERRQLENVMVVVTRYFGGIKLGAGGLVRAYSGTAAKCLDRAGVIELFPMTECTIRAGFEWASDVHNLLDRFSAQKIDESYESEGLVLKIACREIDLNEMASVLRNVSRDRITITKN